MTFSTCMHAYKSECHAKCNIRTCYILASCELLVAIYELHVCTDFFV